MSEKDLKKRLEEHGYTLYGIRHFKNHDRVNFGNDSIKLSLNLRGKISSLAFDALVEACVGKKVEERE